RRTKVSCYSTTAITGKRLTILNRGLEMYFGPVVDPPSQLKVPLKQIAWMEGPTEFDIPAAHPFSTGVLISRNNYLGFYSHDLQKELWSHEVPGAMGSVGLMAGPAQTVLHKPKGSVVTQYEINSGKIRRTIETQTQADLVGSSEHGFLLHSL